MGNNVEHEGKALAADETDGHRPHKPGLASVHVRAAITWCVIFPLVAIGVSLLRRLAPTWPPVLGSLVMTLIIVPLSVYVFIPRLLLLYSRITLAVHKRRTRKTGR